MCKYSIIKKMLLVELDSFFRMSYYSRFYNSVSSTI